MVACSACGEDNPTRAVFCLRCAAALNSVSAMEDVRKIVTVLFADVSGSTALGELLDPESVRALMSRYFSAIKEVIERHGGTVEKFIGDAVMAIFGIPVVHEDDALRAVRAAVDIRDVVALLNSESQTGNRVPLVFRIGLNTGEVVAGDPSIGQTLVTGDPVNTAARLEQAATPGDILLGEATRRLVRDAVTVEPVEPIVAKGKRESVRAYRLLQVIGNEGHARRLDAPMVGRTAELTQLREAFQRTVKDRSCRLVTVLGVAGVGKSRLVAEFLATVGKGVTILTGRCRPYGEGITYGPLAEVVRLAAAIDEGDSPQEGIAKLEAMLGDERDASAIAAVSSAIGLSGRGAPQEQIFWATRKLLDHLAHRQPLVVVVEDIHWAEQTFLDLIEYITEQSHNVPLFILCPARPELLDDRGAWGGGTLTANMLLEALPAEECERLIRELPGGGSLPVAVRERIFTAAEGNPLYLEEMLGMLVDEGLLVRTDGGWLSAAELESIPVPPSIHALLTARLELLAPNERDAAGRAAVVGRTFEQAAVVELSPEALRPEVARSLTAMARKELIRRERSEPVSGPSFTFRHILIRDAAYDSLSKGSRAELHAHFAEWLELTAVGRPLESEEIVGYHFEQAWRFRRDLGFDDDATARLGEAAVEHLSAAAFHALDRSDLRAAAQLLGRALNTMQEDDPRLVELTVERVDALARLGRLPEATTMLEAMRGLRALQTDPRQRAWGDLARLRVASEFGADYDVDQALLLIDRTIPEFERVNDIRGLAHAWLGRAHAHWWQLKAADTFAALEQALAFSRLAGRRSQELAILDWLALTGWAGPTPVLDALAHLEDVRQRAEGDRRIEAAVRLSRASLYAMAGQRNDAERELGAALLTFGELGMAVSLGEGGQVGYWLALGTGDLERERRRLVDGNTQLEAAGAEGFLSTNLGLLAFLLLDLGRPEEAEREARHGLAIASPGDVSAAVTLRMAIASLEARRGDADQAANVAEELLVLVTASDCHPIVGDWLSRAAQIHLAAGNRERAAALFGQAIDRYGRKGARGLVAGLELRMASLGVEPASSEW